MWFTDRLHYKYKADNAMGIKSGGKHVGLIAQEVQKAIPEAVSENEKGYLMLNNDPVLWAMLNAIKEQKKQLGAQQKQLRILQEKVATLAGK